MLKNYLLIALRALRRQQGYTAINLVGLALGLACSLFILLYIQDELKYDRHHEDAEQIYRVHTMFGDYGVALTPSIVAPLFTREFPEVQATTRLVPSRGVVRYEDHLFEESAFYYADSSFFDVFTHPFVHGTPDRALDRPNTVVLTASTAQRYFGKENPVGRTLLVDNQTDYEVTGVIEDLPLTSHYQFDVLASLASVPQLVSSEAWAPVNFYTYVRATDEAARARLDEKMPELVSRYLEADEDSRSLSLMPLVDIHLHANVEYELDPTGDIRYVYGFLTVGVLILLIACINYMNLATARSMQRAREVGVRKALGAFRGQLGRQFFAESAVLTGMALLLALSLVSTLLPAFNQFAGKDISATLLTDPWVLLTVGGVGVFVSFIAGSYPAVFLSRFKPVAVLRGTLHGVRGGQGLRKLLVVAQFGVSTVLIAGTAVVMAQLNYLQDQNLGFDKEHLVVLPIDDRLLSERSETIKADLLSHPSVRAATAITQPPGLLNWTYGMLPLDTPEAQWRPTKGLLADADVIDGLGLSLVAGRAFSSAPPTPDSTNYQFIVNETLASNQGWTVEDAVGQRLNIDGRIGSIIGVVADFHFRSLHDRIEPLTIWYQPALTQYLAVRLAPGEIQGALDHLEATWAVHAAHRPFTYRFLDGVYDRLYRSEQQMGQLASLFAGLAIVIACLGLLGLAAFAIQQRRKELGVRKVLGATVTQVVGLLTTDFLKLIGLALLVGLPVTYLALERWLSGFAYHVELSAGPFLLAAGLLVGIASLTVSSQAIRAALTNPIHTLRQE
ncbi:MAG: ABC transporter permease [Bacteroidota bacterium]